MPTLEEMRKTAKEKRFDFDVSFSGWRFGERRYNLRTEKGYYPNIKRDTLLIVYNTWVELYGNK